MPSGKGSKKSKRGRGADAKNDAGSAGPSDEQCAERNADVIDDAAVVDGSEQNREVKTISHDEVSASSTSSPPSPPAAPDPAPGTGLGLGAEPAASPSNAHPPPPAQGAADPDSAETNACAAPGAETGAARAPQATVEPTEDAEEMEEVELAAPPGARRTGHDASSASDDASVRDPDHAMDLVDMPSSRPALSSGHCAEHEAQVDDSAVCVILIDRRPRNRARESTWKERLRYEQLGLLICTHMCIMHLYLHMPVCFSRALGLALSLSFFLSLPPLSLSNSLCQLALCIRSYASRMKYTQSRARTISWSQRSKISSARPLSLSRSPCQRGSFTV